MARNILLLIGTLACALGFSAHADFIRSGPVDTPSLAQLISQIQQIARPGIYKGIDSLGQTCQVQIDFSSDPNQPFVTVRGRGSLTLQLPLGGEVVSYLFANSEANEPGQVEFIGEVDRQETQAFALYINIVGKNGVPSSVQFGVPRGAHGGSRPFQPGDVVSPSAIYNFPACSGLTESVPALTNGSGDGK